MEESRCRAPDDIKEPEWELFDWRKDPREMCSGYDDPAYAEGVKELKAELRRLQLAVADEPYHKETELPTRRNSR